MRLVEYCFWDHFFGCNFKLIPCRQLWRVCLDTGWSCYGEFPLVQAFEDHLGLTSGLGVGL